MAVLQLRKELIIYTLGVSTGRGGKVVELKKNASETTFCSCVRKYRVGSKPVFIFFSAVNHFFLRRFLHLVP